MNTPEDIRTAAIKNFSDGSEKLRQAVEERRMRDAGESLSMRRKIYSAVLATNDLELILGFAKKAGLPTHDENEILRNCVRKIIIKAPTYLIERELTLKLEAQTRPITENDFRDMQTFCAVVAYADVVIAENQFSNLAQQAGLDKKYETHIFTDLSMLPKALEVSSTIKAGP